MKKLLLSICTVFCLFVSLSAQERLNETNRELLNRLSSSMGVTDGEPFVAQWEGMLWFNSTEQYEEYLTQLDDLRANWVYTREDEYWDTPQHINYVGDEALLAVDARNNIVSLGVYQERQKFEGNIREIFNEQGSSVSRFMAEPFYQKTLNRSKEVRIGDAVFKYYDGRYAAILENPTLEDLTILRNDEIIMDMPNLSYYDRDNGTTETATARGGKIGKIIKKIFGIPCGPPTGICVPLWDFYAFKANYNNNYNQFYVLPIFEMGEEFQCKDGSFEFKVKECKEVKFEIDFGDGSPIKQLKEKEDFIHTFPAISKLGECKEYTIKVKVILGKACKCGTKEGDSFTKEYNVKICRPQDCVNYTAENSASQEYNNNGIKYRIIARIGQEVNAGKFGIFNKSSIWSTCENQKWSNKSGEFVSASGPNSVSTRLYGYVYTNSCKDEQNNDKYSSAKKTAEVRIKFDVDIASERTDFWKKVKSNNITGTTVNIHALPIFP